MSLKQLSMLLVLRALSPAFASSAWLENVPQAIRQPDAQTVQCFVTGDEYNSRLHDKQNFTIIQDPSTGYYVYAVTAGGDLVPTAHVVGRVNPLSVGLTPGATIVPSKMLERRKALIAEEGGLVASQECATPRTGMINNLVIFIRFSDEEEFTDSVVTYDSRFNGPSGKSLRNYFRECSYDALTITSTFYPWTSGPTVISYQDVYPRAYYMAYDASSNPIGYQSGQRMPREQSLLKSALMYVAGQVPSDLAIDNDADGRVDNVVFIASGFPTAWSSILWPHKASLTYYTVYVNGKQVYSYNFQVQSRTDYPMLCHEMFHSLGAPDLYHYSFRGDPVDGWDLMGDGGGHTGAYMKHKYGGWITAIPQITTPGIYSLRPLTSATNNGYRIASPYSATEYFIVEYRKKEGVFESTLPWQGLLVYRINTNVTGNANGPPDEVYIYRPDGTPTSNGNYYYASLSSEWGRSSINDTTNPYSFLSDGSPGGLNISEVGPIDSLISFRVSFVNSPSITSILPSVTAVGGKALTLDVYGANFYPTSVVRVNGNDRVTLYVSEAHLRADIVTQDLMRAGKLPVTVFTPGRGLSNADILTIFFFPDQVSLVAPPHDAVIGADSIQLVWSKAYPEVIAYHLDVATDSDFVHADTDSAVTDTCKSIHPLVSGQQYFWRVRAKNMVGWGNPSEVRKFHALFVDVANVDHLPTHFRLEQNYPNPFNPNTTIRYGLPNSSHVLLTVFNMLGQQVAQLVNGEMDAGYHDVKFDGLHLASGVYLYRMQAGVYVETRSLLLIR